MIGFFEEDTNSRSMMRLMSFFFAIATIASAFITLYQSFQVRVGPTVGTYVKVDVTAGIYITLLLATIAVCPKALQKFMEIKKIA
ncbi:hypothetical protein KAR91_08525 [Candidatus Pacearchaeota archaeon]|nr:hypothetical protein [Candidatus Pacearchaeota archaeon]